MKPKKNPSAEVSRNSSLYFLIGLALTMFATYHLLEHKTYVSNEFDYETLQMEAFSEEDIPITEQIKIPPPPPPEMPVATSEIEVVEDDIEIEETLIESTESNQDIAIAEPVISVDEVIVEEVEEEVSVPFAVIENVPIYPGCESFKSNEDLKKCFNEKMQQHIIKHFKYPETAQELGIDGKVFVMFDIDKTGIVTNIRKRGPNPMLEDEAVRIISLLPKMQPGKQRGHPVKVGYSLPVNFVLLN